MGFLYRVRDAVARFMYGRNGVDQLCWALVIAEVVLTLLARLINIPAVTAAVNLVTTVMIALALYRMLSRNLYKRREENARFLRWWGPIAGRFRGASARRADSAHKYVKCACGAMCRVPRGVGKVELTCPKCGQKKIVKT